MNEENVQKLINSCPNLYSYPHLSIGCGDGWFDLLYSLSGKLEQEILKFPKEEQKLIYATDIKSKFGELRFSISVLYGAEFLTFDRLIQEAEAKAAITCERCGKYAQQQTINWWIYTLCSTCYRTRLKSFGASIKKNK